MEPIHFSTFVFFDLGSDGLLKHGFRPHVTEISLIAVDRFMLGDEYEALPSRNKITLRLDQVPPNEAALSGLNAEIVEIIKCFLRRLAPPICMVAHNGIEFDFPLFQLELHRVNRNWRDFCDRNHGPVYCSDSLHLCRQFANLLSTTPEDASFALAEVYRRVFGRIYDFAHSTEPDCLAMIKIVQHLGELAIEWFDTHYSTLASTPLP
ncbi:unnamed protein product [Hymenolepis diminuta]|uniref:Exonuclease domain-containing protein n=1 Tax=Hymenolepis diminuta TaxID=6216 RepID=A0A564YMU2_HYMDI|nr:unnamed protein product [Hymenolepis diminuta]